MAQQNTQPAKIDFILYQGTTQVKKFVWQRRTTDPTTGDKITTPVDITGMDALMHVRERVTDKDPLIVLSSANGSIVYDDPLAGSFYLLFTPDITTPLYFDEGEFSVKFTDLDGDVHRVIEGVITLDLDVTRSV